MAILKQKNTNTVFNGWYGTCDECEPFDLTILENRSKILKVLQITNDNKSYTKFDATIDSTFDNEGGLQDFLSLECGKAYLIILKPGDDELVISGFTETKIDDEGVGKIIEMESCDFYAVMPSPSPSPSPSPNKLYWKCEIFESTGFDQEFVTPPDVSEIFVQMWGAGGSSGRYQTNQDAGGCGGYAEGRLTIYPNEKFIVGVGESSNGKTLSTYRVPGYSPGGKAGHGGSGNHKGAGAGGGMTGLFKNTISENSAIMIAGGGGGAAGSGTAYASGGGGGGGVIGINGSRFSMDLDGGVGGSQEKPGITRCVYGNSTDGTRFNGGDGATVGDSSGGGGGAGWFGGGGGCALGGEDSSGGGGSGYLSSRVRDGIMKIGNSGRQGYEWPPSAYKPDNFNCFIDEETLSNAGSPDNSGLMIISYETKHPTPIDCEGYWSDFTECDSECGGGVKTKSYIITKEEKNGGTCKNRGKKLIEECNSQPCDEIREDGMLYLKTFPDAYYPSAEFFGCSVNTYAGILKSGLKTKYARKYGHGSNGDADGRYYSFSVKPRQVDFKGNIIAIGNPRAENSTGVTLIWRLGEYKQTDCIGNSVYKTSGSTNNLSQGVCDPINKLVRGDASSYMESSKMLTLNRTSNTVYIGAPSIMRMDSTQNGTDIVGGYKDIPINTSNGITTQNNTTLNFHRFVGDTYNNSSLNIDDMATDYHGNLAISQPARTKGDGRSFGAVQINDSVVYSPEQANGYFGRVTTGGKVLVGGKNFFAVSNSKIGKVYIISELNGSWMIRYTIKKPSTDISVSNFGVALSATSVIKNNQYLAVHANEVDESEISVIYVYKVNSDFTMKFCSKIKLTYKLSNDSFCINSRTHNTFGETVDVYTMNPHREYKRREGGEDAIGTIDCYDGLTGKLRNYTEWPKANSIEVADGGKQSLNQVGQVLVCSGSYLAAVCGSYVRQNHENSSPGMVTSGDKVVLVFDIKSD